MSLLQLDLDGLLAEYERTVETLGIHLGELAQARAAENETRLATWFTAPADTAKHRDLMADHAAQGFKRDLYVSQAHVDADNATLRLLDHLIARVLG